MLANSKSVHSDLYLECKDHKKIKILYNGDKLQSENRTNISLKKITQIRKKFLLQDDDGQITDAHSISDGLDYPGIGPEHSWLHDVGRVNYVSATDEEALVAFQLCSRLEGIIPALEPSHALAYLSTIIGDMDAEDIVILNMCGRGDKDLGAVLPVLEKLGWK